MCCGMATRVERCAFKLSAVSKNVILPGMVWLALFYAGRKVAAQKHWSKAGFVKEERVAGENAQPRTN